MKPFRLLADVSPPFYDDTYPGAMKVASKLGVRVFRDTTPAPSVRAFNRT